MVAFCRRSWISRSTNSSWVLPRSSPAETRTSPWAPCWCANLHPTSARWLLCRGMQSFVRDSRLREKKRKLWLSLSFSVSPRGEQFGVRGKKTWQKNRSVDSRIELWKSILKPSRVFHSFSLWQRSMLFQNHCVFHDHFFSTVSSVRVNLIRKI